MNIRQTLSADLPAPRDDEPPSLRQDILDELADHLACAYRRELLRGADAAAAQACVLERFGDPAAVARRLWFDAMKGKIMTQRLLIGTCFLLLIVGCGATFALVQQQSIRAERQVAEANSRLTQALAQAQATNQEMLKQLQKMAEAVQPGQSPDWIPVSFKLTQETLDGPPAAGYEVELGRAKGGTQIGMGSLGTEYPPLIEVIHRVSDEKGLVDFGVVRPGDWQFDLVGMWKGQNAWHSRGTLSILPGVKIVKSIICPKAPPDTGPVVLHVAWPPDLAAKDYVLEASFTHQGATYQAPLHWTLGPNANYSMPSNRAILCGLRDGELKYADLRMADALYYWQFADQIKGMVDLGIEKSNPTRLFADLRTEFARLEATAVKLDVGNYQLASLVVLRSRPTHQLKIPGERFDVLAFAAVEQFGWLWVSRTINTVFKPPDVGEPAYAQNIGMVQGWGTSHGQWEPARSRFVAVSHSFWQGGDAHFAVQPAATNAWTIHLPDELINAIRDQLKTDVPAKPKAG